MSKLAASPLRWNGWLTKARDFLAVADISIIDYPFAQSDVARLHRLTAGPDVVGIDDQTADDMLLDRYAATLTPETSIFGQQMLYRRLRQGRGVNDRARVEALLADATLARPLQDACRGLRKADVEVAGVLFADHQYSMPGWCRYLWLLPLALLLSLLAITQSVLALGAVVVVWMTLLAVQMRFSEQVKEWDSVLITLQQMLRSYSLLGAGDETHAAAAGLQPFRDGRAQSGKLNRSISRSPMIKLPLVGDYSDWVLLDNVKHYFKSRQIVQQNRAFLRQALLEVAALDADLALARHLRREPGFCWAGHSDEAAGQRAVTLTRVVHPLLADAAPLSLVLEGKGAFISGQNGIGKSTLLRTVGLNLIVARGFGFCYGEAALLPAQPLPVYSSMQSEDSLTGGESLYLAELRRARELLTLAEQGPAALFIIDEIFRGTNHIESVSAAAALLDTLAGVGLVIVSSHNLVLAALLNDSLTPLCVSAPDGDRTRLTLAPGVLADTNGITLLASRGLGGAIEGKARRVYDWLNGYLAHPGDCAHVLRTEPFTPESAQLGSDPAGV